MKNFYHYLAETQKTYKYRIKTLVEVNDDVMDCLETCLAKYDLADVSKPKKTIVQNYPLDFKDVSHGEVYIIDVVTRCPASSAVLLQDLIAALGCSERHIVVRGENEPLELQAEKLISDIENATDAPATALLNDAEYGEVAEKAPDAEYGDAYNKQLLDYLAKVSSEREEITVTPSDGNKMFDWLKNQKPGEDFNKGYETPKPVHRSKAKKSAKDPTRVGPNKN